MGYGGGEMGVVNGVWDMGVVNGVWGMGCGEWGAMRGCGVCTMWRIKISGVYHVGCVC